MSDTYNTDHLTLTEIKQVATEVFKHWMAVMAGAADDGDMLYTDPEELGDEYQFWAGEVERRSGYDNTPQAQNN